MNKLAKEAFDANNFEIAAEILEKTVVEEDGANSARLVSLGDCYACAGQLKNACDAYSKAFQFGNVSPLQLNHLVTALVHNTSRKQQPDTIKMAAKRDIFACAVCETLWTEAVTLKCGHTFCRHCLSKEEVAACTTCGVKSKLDRVVARKPNVILSQIVAKWFPQEFACARLKMKATQCLKEELYTEAVDYFSQALHIGT